MKFSAHFNTLLQHLSPSKRIETFAEMGYKAFELWGWWETDIDQIANAAQKHNIEVAAICTRFVSLTDASQRTAYLTGLNETLNVCKKLNCNTIISQVGDALPERSRKMQTKSIIEGLKECTKILESTEINLCIEPLNLLVDHKGYFLSTSKHASTIIKAVNHANVSMLFDIYHQHITEGNIINNINAYKNLIGHYHMADYPGRNEPGTGEINFAKIFSAIRTTGYKGYVGLEFFPKVEKQQKMLTEFLEQFNG